MQEKKELNISIIIPVYNRPDEIEELLESLKHQTRKDVEIVIVEDGSSIKCDSIIKKYKDDLLINYFYKENTGPGQSRNYGCEKATGNYFLFMDSDCILPPQYLEIVFRELGKNYVDTFGGPDMAHEDFNTLQKAINYSMTSFFTTGGIRGGGEKLEKFNPRSFNMGFSKEVFKKTGGFPSIRFAKAKAAGEDLDLSIQIKKLGFSIRLIKDAFLYHKRRTNLKQFYKQVNNFGFARITIFQRHPESLKILHFAPAVFTLGLLGLIISSIFIHPYFLFPIILHIILLFFDSTIKNKSITIGFISVITSYIQLVGYGLGFMKAFVKRLIFKSEGF